MFTPDDRKRAALSEIIRHPEKSYWEVAKDYRISDATLYRLRAEARPVSLRPSDAAPDEDNEDGNAPGTYRKKSSRGRKKEGAHT